jgi:hypothetical protein
MAEDTQLGAQAENILWGRTIDAPAITAVQCYAYFTAM